MGTFYGTWGLNERDEIQSKIRFTWMNDWAKFNKMGKSECITNIDCGMFWGCSNPPKTPAYKGPPIMLALQLLAFDNSLKLV